MKFFCEFCIFALAFVAVVCYDFQVGNGRRRQTSFERFDSTCGIRSVVIIFRHNGVKIVGNQLIMNTTVTVKEDILTDPRMTVSIDRCSNKENLDTCEHFYTHKIESYCSILESDSALWKPLFLGYEPEFKCPLKKGLYKATNTTIDLAAFLLFPVDAWFWRVKIEVHDKEMDKMLLCINAEAHITTKGGN